MVVQNSEALRYENVSKSVSGRIAYWQAKVLKQKGESPLQKALGSHEEIGRLIDRPHEKIPESVVRTTLAEQYGIKPEEVTWDQMMIEVERLSISANYLAVELVPTASAAYEDQPRFFYRSPNGSLKSFGDQIWAMLPADPSMIDESSPLKELAAPAPTRFDELQRLMKDRHIEYLLEPDSQSIEGPEKTPGGRPKARAIAGEKILALRGDATQRAFSRALQNID